jgi:cytochrome P450
VRPQATPMNTYDQLAQDRASAIRCLLSAGSPFHDAVSGSWFVSDYGTVRKVLARPDLMARDAENATAGLTESQREKVEPLERHFRRWLAFSDDENQRDLRRLVRQALASKSDAARPARLRESARRLAPRPLSGSELVRDFVAPFTAEAMIDVLGAEHRRQSDLLAWGVDLVAYLGLGRYRDQVVTRALSSLRQLESYVSQWIRSAHGAVPEAVREAIRRGATHEDAAAGFAQLLTGGIEPTRAALIVGAASVSSPGRAAEFQRDPEAYVSEVLRVASPFHFAPRTAGTDLRVGDSVIPAGARVSVALCAANHDPERFPEPEAIDPSRTPRGHLAFGHGRHFCAGAGFAEEILVAGLEALLEAGLGKGGLRVSPHYDRTGGMTRASSMTISHSLS